MQQRLFGVSRPGIRLVNLPEELGCGVRIAPLHFDPGAPPEDFSHAPVPGRCLDKTVVPLRRTVEIIEHPVGTRNEESDIGLITKAADIRGQRFDRLFVFALAEEESSPEFEVLLYSHHLVEILPIARLIEHVLGDGIQATIDRYAGNKEKARGSERGVRRISVLDTLDHSYL